MSKINILKDKGAVVKSIPLKYTNIEWFTQFEGSQAQFDNFGVLS
jgi:hypothetical protein